MSPLYQILDAENELISLSGWMAEVFDVHQADSGCGKQTDDSGTEDGKDTASYFMILVLDDDMRNPYHHQKWQPDHRYGSKDTAKDAK